MRMALIPSSVQVTGITLQQDIVLEYSRMLPHPSSLLHGRLKWQFPPDYIMIDFMYIVLEKIYIHAYMYMYIHIVLHIL